jgi:hypothetical protein
VVQVALVVLVEWVSCLDQAAAAALVAMAQLLILVVSRLPIQALSLVVQVALVVL